MVLNLKLLNVENNNYYDEYDEKAFSSFVQTNFGAATNNLSELYKELGIGGAGSVGTITTNQNSVMGILNNSNNTNSVINSSTMPNNGVVIVCLKVIF